MSEQQTEKAAAPFAAPEDNPRGERHAAYDTQLGRFVGGTHDSAEKAKRAAKDRGVESGNVKIVKV